MTADRPHYATIAVWVGETENAAYERATQVPVVHSISGPLRYSTGIEDVEDLIEDLQRALAALP
jgi:cystathionine beta-lyase/cystathionine gamma-synthase